MRSIDQEVRLSECCRRPGSRRDPWNKLWNKLRRTGENSAARNADETGERHPSAPRTLRLGAGRSQVQILSPRLMRLIPAKISPRLTRVFDLSDAAVVPEGRSLANRLDLRRRSARPGSTRVRARR